MKRQVGADDDQTLCNVETTLKLKDLVWLLRLDSNSVAASYSSKLLIIQCYKWPPIRQNLNIMYIIVYSLAGNTLRVSAVVPDLTITYPSGLMLLWRICGTRRPDYGPTLGLNLTRTPRVIACLAYPCSHQSWISQRERGRLIHRAELNAGGVGNLHPHGARCSQLLRPWRNWNATWSESRLPLVSNILADCPATIRRHYAKWTPEFQARQDRVIRLVHGTNLAQAEEHASRC
jgi:hypothetical protein